jgi:hypothetical protein
MMNFMVVGYVLSALSIAGVLAAIVSIVRALVFKERPGLLLTIIMAVGGLAIGIAVALIYVLSKAMGGME